MKKQLVATLIIIAIPLFFVSCVSSILKDKPPTFSRKIKLIDPKPPFIKTEASVYPSWKSTKTGNVIAIVSDCSETSSYKLSNLYLLIEDPLENIKVLKEETIALQNRPAISRHITAQLDRQPIEVQSISFKRNSCGYVASLSGKINNLESDKRPFEQFINGFSFE